MSGIQGLTVKYQKDESVGIVTLNRPEVLNALNKAVFEELGFVFDKIARDEDVKAVILTGVGKAFAAGADIEAMKDLSPLEARQFALAACKTQEKISALPKPTIAAINGYALGGGCELAMCCDLRIASENARLGQPEINLGIIPGGGGTQRLARLVGLAKAKELVFTGKMIDAQEACQIGLVNKVVQPSELMAEAIKLARDLASKSAPALSLAKAALDHGYGISLEAALGYEIECFAQCFATEDHREGMSAFLAKRAPEYKDR
jgi:enoyl-CoA hydratase